MYNEKRIRNSELLQVILLDTLYAQSGSERIIFQGGTALRWVYGGTRSSEDLDFVTNLSSTNIIRILDRTFQHAKRACIAQFGPGHLEQKSKSTRKEATKTFFIFRPETQRERIAVKLEFEFLNPGNEPGSQKFILRDLPSVSGLITSGKLIMPYSSSIVIAETPEEILSDKVRAIYERKYLKGRDIYDIWWLRKLLKVTPAWTKVRDKLSMYQTPFVPAREAVYFQKRASVSSIVGAIERDLPRFLPQNILSMHQEEAFLKFIAATKEVTSALLDQGMKKYFEDYERRKSKS
ncbi:MAG: nucleotidyl transferase AbiEii/AbiGii toxin family protein [Deltaproteobacteria bacterium]|nr:nucleotidyl transferase AbiEii/AbiGii toxin family protein [Deltaproteobacteria bacterium]MBW2318389.1 nucleotidyl transferase AbiEii/AbiGii toxin family protein [Deltaproteobacteria bacterium]